MTRSEVDATRAIDSTLGRQLAGPALPFSGAAGGGGVACHVLDAPEGATHVPLALGVFPWRIQGALRLTVIAKATFSIAGEEAAPVAPEPLQVRDVHHKNRPLAHAVAVSDRVPWKTAVDVTLLGHAHAPGGSPATEARARFALSHGGTVLLDRAVRVVGDWRSPNDAPKPFTSMPIVYERAHGGMGIPANPVGVGPDDDEQPNVLDPASPWRPAGFGPLAGAWPLRHKLLGTTPRKDVDAPIMALPAGFPFAYFQSAPQDQQIVALPPDAVMLLEGLHPERATVQIALPGARVAGAAYGLDEADPDAPAALAFRLDTLHVDADRLLATLVFRSLVHLRDEAQIARIAIAAGAALGGREPAVPPRRPAPGSRGGVPATSLQVPAAGAASTTGTLDPLSSATRGPGLPFASASTTLAFPDQSVPPAAVPFVPAAPDAGQAGASAASPLGPAPAASAFFHDLSKLRSMEALVPRAKDEAPPKEPSSPEEIELERYAALCATLAEPDAELAPLLEAAGVDTPIFRKSDRRWRKALEQETRRGKHELRDRFDDAYVRTWEEKHPDRFGAAHYARLKQAEERGLLLLELDEQSLDTALGMRLRRVWRRRVAGDAAVRDAFEKARGELREE